MDEMQQRDRWQYYISSFVRVEPTEGVPRERMQKVVLQRNMPRDEPESGRNDKDSGSGSGGERSSGEHGGVPKPVAYEESLRINVCLNSCKMVWGENTSEYFVYDHAPRDPARRARRALVMRAHRLRRETQLTERLVLNNAWMKDKSQEEVQSVNEAFRKWMDDGVVPGSGPE